MLLETPGQPREINQTSVVLSLARRSPLIVEVARDTRVSFVPMHELLSERDEMLFRWKRRYFSEYQFQIVKEVAWSHQPIVFSSGFAKCWVPASLVPISMLELAVNFERG